jgi:hypothetical protein
MLAAFRSIAAEGKQMNWEEAARRAGCDSRTARRAYHLGWPGRNWLPAREVLADEQFHARAARMELEIAGVMEQLGLLTVEQSEAAAALAAARQAATDKLEQAEVGARRRIADLFEKAHMDGMEQAADEALLSKSARKNAMNAQGFVAMAWGTAKVLAEKIGKMVREDNLSQKNMLMLMKELVRATREVNMASRLAIELERLRVGDPTEIVGVKLEPPSIEEAARDIEHAAELLAMARRRHPLAHPTTGDTAVVVVDGAGEGHGSNGNGNGNGQVH